MHSPGAAKRGFPQGNPFFIAVIRTHEDINHRVVATIRMLERFRGKKVYQRYAEMFLDPDQIDVVDVVENSRLPAVALPAFVTPDNLRQARAYREHESVNSSTCFC